MHTIYQLLQKKGNQVWSIHPDATVYEALQLLADKDIGALPVIQDGQLVGIFSERDYARKVILHGKSSMDTRVSEIMTPRVICLQGEQNIQDAMALMTERHIRHLPVIEDDRVIGIITIGDVVKDVISTQEFVIEQLEHYISGDR